MKRRMPASGHIPVKRALSSFTPGNCHKFPNSTTFSLAMVVFSPYSIAMNTIVVFSDLHGDSMNFNTLLERYEEEDGDLLLCAGDLELEYLGSVWPLLAQKRIPFLMVRGNCDAASEFHPATLNLPPRYRSLDFGDHTIGITHGDRDPAWESAPFPLASQDIFITGHTHIAKLTHPKKAPWLLNPGSASRPRNSRHCSYAVITHTGISVKKLKNGHILHKLCTTFA